MKRKIASLALLLVLLLSLVIPASALTANEARNSVVVIATFLETGAGNIGLSKGTGFFVSDQYLVTNYHVIEDFEDYGAGELLQVTMNGTKMSGRAKVRAYYDSKDYEEAYVVGFDSIRDVAILRLGSATKKRTPLELKAPTEDMVGSPVYAIGFPGLADNVYSDSVSSWSKNDATVTSGTISRLSTQSGTGQRNVQIDCDIKHGNSGGPVIDENGAVIGIATWYINSANETIKYAVNIEDAIELMNQYRVPYTMAGENDFSSSVLPNPTPSLTPEPTPKANIGLIVAIVVAVVAVVAVVVLVVLLLRKKKPAPGPVVPPPPVAPRKVPTVRSCAKVNYGSHVPVSSQPVMIGRSSLCTLRFPSNAPGISGNHCSVQWDSRTNDFIVMDLNSTYGTFLMTGQKMAPNVPYRMRPGDKFYLADQNNIMALELE